MANKKFTTVNISVTANGYIVRPDFPRNCDRLVGFEESYVFESNYALNNFLDARLEKPEDK